MIDRMLRAALEALRRGEVCALVSVIDTEGSTPGSPGQKMIVYPDGRQEGTVGGGTLELHAKKAALEHLKRHRGGILTYALEQDAEDGIGSVCGGRITLAVEILVPQARLLLCGAGHVAAALAPLCSSIGVACTVVDGRADMASRGRFPDALDLVVEPPPVYVQRADLSPYTHLVIMTHGHALDATTLRAAFERGFEGYIGVIGSRRKWAEVKGQLIADGVPESWLDRIRCPIGVDIGARTPQEIAVSIAAELIQERSRRREPS